MFSNDLKEMHSQINPSEELIKNTKLALKHELARKKTTCFHMIYRTIPLAACLVLVVITAFQLSKIPLVPSTKQLSDSGASSESTIAIAGGECEGFSLEQDQLQTKLVPNIHQDSVSLVDGDLYFNQFISQPITNPQKGGFSEPFPYAQVIDELGIDPIPSYIPEDLMPVKEFAFFKDPNSAQYHLSLQELNPNFQSQARHLNITFAKGSLPNPTNHSQNQSIIPSLIGKTELFLWYTSPPQDSEQTVAHYTASFTCHDIGYFIESSNLTQEEFIKILLSIIQ